MEGQLARARLRQLMHSARVLARLCGARLLAARWGLAGTALALLILVRLGLYMWFMHLPPDHPSIVCSFGEGRLGNQISSFASLRSVSLQFGLQPIVTQAQAAHLGFYFDREKLGLLVLEEDFPQYFISILGWKICRLYWTTPWPKISSVDNHYNYSQLASPSLHRGLALDMGDYPNLVSSYAPHLPELRQLLQPRQQFREVAQARLRGALQRRGLGAGAGVTWVGVHNRRGDYGQHLASLYSLPLLGPEFFLRAMRHYSAASRGPVVFVVVSDDLAWARRHLATSGHTVEFLGHSAVLAKDTARPLATGRDVGEDLALLAACNHSVLSYGTYGMWAAMLAGGQVVISPSMALTKEGGELQEASLPGWLWLGEDSGEQGERRGELAQSSAPPRHSVTCLVLLYTVDVFCSSHL